MGKVEDALRDLIQYHGRKAARYVLDDLPDTVKELRREVRGIKKALGELRDQVGELMEERREDMAVPPAPEEKVEEARVTRRTVKSIRKKFDLRQDELAELLDISPATVSSWETGQSRPRGKNKAKLVTLREKGKSEVDEALGRVQRGTAFEAEDIVRLRHHFGLTQKELAQLLDVSPPSVWSWEKGKSKPHRDNVEALARLQEMEKQEVLNRVRREEPAESREETAEQVGLSSEDIRSFRKEAGLSQTELAERLDVSPHTISNWETGNTAPRGKSLEKLRSFREEQENGDSSRSRVRQLRQKAGLSQKQLAEELGVSSGTVSNWETGATNPRGKILERLRRFRQEQESGDSPASRIKQLRKKAGLDQKQLAEELGVSSGTVSSWETGKSTPSELYVEALEQVAQGGG